MKQFEPSSHPLEKATPPAVSPEKDPYMMCPSAKKQIEDKSHKDINKFNE